MRKLLLAIVLCLTIPALSHAQTCKVVTPSGSGTGSGADWNNAMAGLPVPLARGTTYFLADGTYSEYYAFDVPVNGTSTVTIKKAEPTGSSTAAATHCTDVGWNASTMGSGQAKMVDGSTSSSCSTFWIANSANTGYLTVDGVTGSGETGSSYGISLQEETNASYCDTMASDVWIGVYGAYSATNISFSHVEMIGACGGLALNSSWLSNCQAITNTPKIDSPVFAYNCTNCTFSHDYLHDSSADFIDPASGNGNWTVSDDFMQRNSYTSSEHSEVISLHGGNTNIVIARNVWQDVAGTAGIGDTGSSGTDSYIYLYDTIIYNDGQYGFSGYGFGDGIMWTTSSVDAPDWYAYQNDIVNMSSVNDGIVMTAPSNSVFVENNVWYGSTASATSFTLGSGSVEDYNSFLNYANAPSASGANDVTVASGSPDPFTSLSTGDFTLASDNANWNNRASLSSGAWNVDAAGTTFTTDRGAYQYVSGSPIPNVPVLNTATAGTNQVALGWSAATYATDYNVLDSTTSGGPYSPVTTLTGTSYTVTGLTGGQQYCFVVTASNSSGTSADSNELCATPTSSAPAAPVLEGASAGNTRVSLSWSAPSGATTYTLYDSTTSGSGYSLVASGLTSTSYTVTGLTNGTEYYFVVIASNSSGSSPYSNELGATPTDPTLVIPTGLLAVPY